MVGPIKQKIPRTKSEKRAKRIVIAVGAAVFLIWLNMVSETGFPHLEELGGGYYLSTSGRERVIQHPIKSDSRDEIAIISIGGNVKKYAFDSDFIVAAVCPKDSVKGISNTTYSEQKKLLEESTFREYFILDKRIDSVYGPHNIAQFVEKCIQLKVPEKIRQSNR